MKDNIKPEDLHAVNTKSFGDTQAKGEASMKKKYVVWCNQRKQYFGATNNLKDTTHFKSLNSIKKWLLDYHYDVDEKDKKILKTYNVYQIANQFDWEIQEIK